MKRRANNSKTRPDPTSAAHPAAPNPSPKKTLTPAKTWLFRLTAFFIIPLLFVAICEIGLRLAGYGYPTALFKPIRIGQTEYLVENDKFGLRFFPPALARSPPPIVMKAHKPPGTYRIFILGESAALGDPRPAFGPGRYLQALLQQRFPGTEFEVVCTATTAINSHAILPIARECAAHEPDCWIVYMGNNEMVGPFGAATVFGARAPPRFLVRLSLAAQRLRLGQLLGEWARKLRSHSLPANSWAGMEMFLNNRLAPDDPRRDAVQKNFKANLEDILRVIEKSRAPALLNTVAVNLKDCAPFASLPAVSTPASQSNAFDIAYAQARASARDTNATDVPKLFEDAAKIQPRFAELEFLWGEALLASTNAAAARHFQLACDDDALPFRATSSINAEIAQAAARRANTSLTLLDAAALFATNAPSPGLPGQETFYEHVHFNFTGNYLLGRAWAEFVARSLPATMTKQQRDHWGSQAECEAQLALTDWNRASVLEDMLLRLQQPPFSGQLNQTQRLGAIRISLAELRARMNTNAAPVARQTYESAIAGHPTDHRLHENFAEFLEAVRQTGAATAEWQQVAALTPHHHLGYFQTGRLLALQGKNADARTNLLAALHLRPDLGEGWLELGKIDAVETNHIAALDHFEQARKLQPRDHRVYYQMGKSLSKLGQGPQAIARFRQAVQLRPNSWQERYALAEELAFNGEDKEALAQFREVVRLRPDYATARFNLGVALFKAGRSEEAKAEFTETLRLNPQNGAAKDYLRQLEQAPLHFP